MFFFKIWNSPTIMTWMSYSTRALSLFVVLPMILRKFDANEVSYWYLLTSIIALLSLADLGFKTTFSRVITFAASGSKDIEFFKDELIVKDAEVNWVLMERICSLMKSIYKYLSVSLLLLTSTIGSLLLIKPISLLETTDIAWLSWFIVCLGSVVRFYGSVYLNYLEGMNEIALVRRIDAFMNLGLILTSIIILSFNGGILELVSATNIWFLFFLIRNRYLARNIYGKKFKNFTKIKFDRSLFLKIWEPAWKSGISGFMSNGITQLTGIMYAQVGNSVSIASYLLAIKIITQIKDVSSAPFYSKIPLMIKLRVQNKIPELIKISQKGMFLSYMVFVLATIFFSEYSENLLNLIGSNVPFVSKQFWILLSLAFLIHRYGAMHIQLYSTTNHIISHYADGVSGVLYVIISFLLLEKYGLYAFIIGMFVGYLGFYSWYSAKFSLNSLKINFFKFEKKGILIPLIILIIFSVFYI